MDRNQLLNDSETAFRIGLDGRQAMTWTALPAFVTKVNFSAMTIECQPTIQGIITLPDESEQKVNLPVLVDVPIVFPNAGNFMITFPIAIGDEVLVVFSSRCIDSWWDLSGVQPPAESRMHDLSDAIAIPGPKSKPNVYSSISSTDIQIRNKSGTSFISIAASDGSVKITAPTVTVTGDMTVSGTITAIGEITGGATAIPLSTHTHPVTSAPGTTGEPIP